LPNEPKHIEHINSSKRKTSEEQFIENRPSWFVPDAWISIDDFYARYLNFDNFAKLSYFARLFKDVLWDTKKEIKKKTHYRLMDLWKSPEYIYLVREREFINSGEQIYKVGRSKQNNCARVGDYPKGSELILIVSCGDCTTKERELLTTFRDTFICRVDIGREYFEGDVELMKTMIYQILFLFFFVECYILLRRMQPTTKK
jgi:hypothetical protein